MKKKKMLKGGNLDLKGIFNKLQLPNENETYLKGKTGLGGIAEDAAASTLNAFFPMAGDATKLLGQVGKTIKGDGTDVTKNLIGNILNPLNSINKVAEGRFLEAIPYFGSFAEAEAANNEMKRIVDEQRANDIKSNQSRSQTILNGYPTNGIRYEMGGNLLHDLSIKKGGKAIPLSKNSAIFEGNSHNEGGIDLAKNGKVIAEVEKDEVIKDDKIYSDALFYKNNLTFAKQAEKLSKNKGEMEKALEQRPNDVSLKNGISIKEEQLENLFNTQENTKAEFVEYMKNNKPVPKALFGLDLSSIKDLAKNVDTSKFAPYLDNAANAVITNMRQKRGVPMQNLTNYFTPTTISNADQINEAQLQVKNLNKNILANSSNSNNANANMLAGISQGIKAINSTNAETQRFNANLLNDAKRANTEIERSNNAITYNNQLEDFKYKDSILSQYGQNASDLSKDMQVQNRDKKAEEQFNQKQGMDFATASERTKEDLFNMFPDLVAKIAPDYYKEKMKNKNSNININFLKELIEENAAFEKKYGGKLKMKNC